jgi:cardiolipin synthase
VNVAGSLPPDALLTAISDVGRTLPTRAVAEFADKLESLPVDPSPSNVDLIVAGIAAHSARKTIGELVQLWRTHHRGLQPVAIAWSLRAAASVDGWHRAAESLELVWTGPAPAGTTLRRTDQSLFELVRSARQELLLVTFAAYRIDALRKALEDAKDRGVSLIFVVESPDIGDGKVSVDPLLGLGTNLGAQVWVWPENKRPRGHQGRHGTLHAKCALADAHTLLVSSANFTGDAMGLNMELGLVVEGGDAPRAVREHFRALMREGVLVLRSAGDLIGSA